MKKENFLKVLFGLFDLKYKDEYNNNVDIFNDDQKICLEIERNSNEVNIELHADNPLPLLAYATINNYIENDLKCIKIDGAHFVFLAKIEGQL